MLNNISALIAARMGSSRLPGKTLSDLHGKPMLDRLVERIRLSKYINEIVVATTDLDEDNPIETWCSQNSVKCFRGSATDVLGRLASAAEKFKIQTIVEILGDNPLVHSSLIDSAVDLFLNNNLDYVATLTNEYPKADKNLKRFPIGVRVQIFSFGTINKCQEIAHEEKHREHATSYIAENPEIFNIGFIDASGAFANCNKPDLNFAVNTNDNLKLINLIFKLNYDSNNNFNLNDAILTIYKHSDFRSLMGDGILRRKSLIPKENYLEKFERFYRGEFAYNLYKILLYTLKYLRINNKKSISILNQKKVNNKLDFIGYKSYFQKLNFQKAYFHRLNHALRLFKHGNDFEKEKANDYLSTIYSDDLIEWLQIDDLKKFKNDSKRIFKLDEQRQKIENILFVGPTANLERINFNQYDKIVFNKPISTDKLNLNSKKIILILNNVWSMFRQKEIFDWYNKNKGSSIITPVKLGIENESNRGFDLIPKYPFRGSGPMGIQRALFLIMNILSFEVCYFEGFDFYLAKKSHKDWYPSLRRIEYGNNPKKAVIIANMEHDYLLNFYFMKKLILHSNKLFSGAIVNLINLDVEEIIYRFKANVTH